MTVRSVILGLVSAALLCGFTYINDNVLRQNGLILNHFPLAIYGSLIVFLLLVNPLLFLLSRRLVLTGQELAIIMMLTLTVCCIPSSGFLREFAPALVLPHNLMKTTPAWNKHKVVDAVPRNMLPAITSQNEGTVVYGFLQGMSQGKQHIAFNAVPWSAWRKPLLFWLPLMLALWVGLLGLGLVIHKQWAEHEQLPYPIAAFTNSLLGDGTRAMGELFRNKLFWLGMAPVLLIHLNNYAVCWYPKYLVPFPLSMNLFPWEKQFFQTLRAGFGASWVLLLPRVIFIIVGLAYFLPAEISLSVGLGPFIWYTLLGTLVTYGVSISGPEPNPMGFLQFGIYFGMLMVLLYIGRRYYAGVFARAIGLRVAAPAAQVWGARVFLLGMAAFVTLLCVAGELDWQIAVLFTALAVMVYVVMGRIIAETGFFFLDPSLYPATILLGLFGAVALGSKAFLITMLLSTLLFVGAREALFPFLMNSFKLLDLRRVNAGHVMPFAALALVIGLAVAVPVTLYYQYDRGVNQADSWVVNSLPTIPFNSVVAVEDRLESQGLLPTANAVHGWGHFMGISWEPKIVVAFIIGAGLIFLFNIVRFRFPRWPLHPVFFLIWSTWPITWFAWSFLLGWLVKVGVTKYGGGQAYRQLKPLMIGLIAGELSAGIVTILIGLVYYLLTGQAPKQYGIIPG